MKLKNLLIIYFITEILLFILVCNLIGIFTTLFLFILTTIIGMILLREHNVNLARKMHQSMQSGNMFQMNFMSNSSVTLAGILLVIPGFLTDIFGLLLLIPTIRSATFRLFSKRAKSKKSDSDVIEGEYWQEDEQQGKINTEKDSSKQDNE